MKLFKYMFVLVLLTVVGIASTHAQRFTKKKRYWSIGMNFNASNYFGDIVPKEQITSFDIKFTKPNLGFSLQRRLTPNISFRGLFAYGAIKGDDYSSVLGNKAEVDDATILSAMENANAKFRLYRNLHFRNHFIELTGSFMIDFKKNRGYFYQRPDGITPYATVGFGVMYHNPQARTPTDENGNGGGNWVNLRPLQTEGVSYSPIALVIPMGFGLKYKVSNKIDISLEVAYRWTTTDYLDDVSGRYYQSHDSTSLSYLLANRSQEVYNTFSSPTIRNRETIITQMAIHYGLVDPSATYADLTDAHLETLNNIYTAPFERRGNDGSPYENPEGQKLGLLSGATDVYMVYGIHVNYILGGGVKCPKFK